jgi:hypothetical protein
VGVEDTKLAIAEAKNRYKKNFPNKWNLILQNRNQSNANFEKISPARQIK